MQIGLVVGVVWLCTACIWAATPLNVLQGTLSISGWSPFTNLTLTTDQGEKYVVQGPFEQELARIGSGWVIEVSGKVSGLGPPTIPARIEVYNYRICSVVTPQGPQEPLVGYLAVIDERMFLVDDNLTSYLLVEAFPGALHALKEKDHVKVAIVGEETHEGSERSIRVDFFHVLSRER